MRDKLDGLSDLLVKLSRVPGLGFLESHGESLTRMKHTVEAHISNMEAKKQGLEEGAEVLRDSVRRRPKDPKANKSTAAQATAPHSSNSPSKQATSKRASSKSRWKTSSASQEAKAKQKLARQLLKRKR